MRDMTGLMRLKRLKYIAMSTEVPQPVHHVGERYGRVNEVEEKYHNLSTMLVRDMAGLMKLLVQQSVHHVVCR